MSASVSLLPLAVTANGSAPLGSRVPPSTLVTMEEIGLGRSSIVPMTVLYTTVTVLAVVGNTLTIIVFSYGKKSSSELSVYLINLACADFIMALFCLPFTFSQTLLKTWIYPDPLCPAVLFLQIVSVTASVSTNTAIGLDRLRVVVVPMSSRTVTSRSRTGVIICAVWLTAVAVGAVQLVVGRVQEVAVTSNITHKVCAELWPQPEAAWRRGYTLFVLCITYLLPLAALSVAYGIICTSLRRHMAPGNAHHSRDARIIRKKRTTVQMLMTIVALFALCWLPLHVFTLTMDFAPQLHETSAMVTVYYAVHWLAMSNSFMNPIIYGFLNECFREDLCDLLRMPRVCRQCFSGRTQQQQPPLSEYMIAQRSML